MSSDRPQEGLQTILVAGLGRFGTGAALALMELGHEVLAVDADKDLVQAMAHELTAAMVADTSNEDAMRQIGADEVDLAIVAIGHVEMSVLTVAVLSDLGVPEIWAKATDQRHGAILERIGAHHVVFPEQQMGARVAKTVSAAVEDYVEFEHAFAVARVHPPAEVVNRTLAESKMRTGYGVVVIGVKRNMGEFEFAEASTRLRRGDMLLVGGRIEDLQRFARLAHEQRRSRRKRR